MLTRLRNVAERLHGSYWFIPTVMLVGAGGLAWGVGYLDRNYIGKEIAESLGLYGGDVEGARALLSTVGGSAITVAGTVFSITIAALTLASGQFGPRLLRNFMRDRGNQIVLGTFVSTYLYCLLVQRSLSQVSEGHVPHLPTTVAVVLGLASLAVLVYFIHHVSASIQAPYVAKGVADEFFRGIDKLYPGDIGQGADAADATPAPGNASLPCVRPVTAEKSGYLQAIDEDDLLALATGCDAVIELLVRPGAFVVKDQTVARFHSATAAGDEIEERLRVALLIGPDRSAEQDVEYSIDQLVEICLRALSPGINDPFTATTCIDWLGAGLSQLAGRKFPSRERLDEKGRLRVIAKRTDFEGAVEAAFNQPRQVGGAHVSVSIRLLDTLGEIAAHCRTASRRATIRRHLDATLAAALGHHPQAIDASVIRAAHSAALTFTRCD